MTLARFIRSSDGAIAIDWVALTAALMVLSVSVLPVIVDELQTLSTTIEDRADAADDIPPLTGS